MSCTIPTKARSTPRLHSGRDAGRPASGRRWDRWEIAEPALGRAKPDPGDNAMAESFFATLECELIERRTFRTQAQARLAVFEYIEGFYNLRRRHSRLGYLTPAEFERRYHNDACDPGYVEPAAVLTSVKDKPPATAHGAAVLDSRCARQREVPVGRDGRMALQGAKQKNGPKKEDKITSTTIS